MTFKTLLVLMQLATGPAANSPYLAWSHNARVLLRWPPIEEAARTAINSTRYEGRWDTGSPICSHYDVSVYVDPARTVTNNLTNFLWTNPGTSFCEQAAIQIHGHAEVSGCPTLDPSVGCTATSCASLQGIGLNLRASCGLGPLPPLTTSSDIVLPFRPAGVIKVDFTHQPPNSTEGDFVTFGHFHPDGSWQDDGSVRSIPLRSRALGIQGHAATRLASTDNASVTDKTRANQLMVAAASWPGPMTSWPSTSPTTSSTCCRTMHRSSPTRWPAYRSTGLCS